MSYEDKQAEQDEMFNPSDGMSSEAAKNVKKTTKRLLQELLPQKWKLILVLVSVVFSSIFTVAAPLVIAKAINIIFDSVKAATQGGTTFSVNLQTMGSLFAMLLVLYAFSGVFSYLQQYTMADVAQKLTFGIRQRLSHKLSRLPLRYYDKRTRGETLSRITNDLERVSDTMQEGLMQLMTALVTLAGAFILMFMISPSLTLVALITIGLAFALTAFVSKTSQKLYMKNQRAMGELNGQIEEVFSGQLEIKAFHKEREMVQTVEALNAKLYKASCDAQFISYAITPAVRFVNQAGYVAIAVLGCVYVAGGSLSLGLAQAFFQYINQASEPLTEAAYILNKMQEAVASAERVFELLDEEEELADTKEAVAFSSPEGRVAFEHVKFGYNNDAILMQDMNFSVKPGQKVAVVGPTGAGKTTLINILMRFYEVQGGKVTIDGMDICRMRRADLRRLFGMVLQDTWLFEGSVEENIGYGKQDASAEAIKKAAKAARADHFIKTLPQSYQTVLNEEGSNISQGQKQLLTIARAILADPSILILDEATSSVDTRTEKEIQKAMDLLMKGRTSFIIAHRLSTILDADYILVMKDGSIIEQGTHQTLIQKQGFYSELYSSQFASASAG